MLWIKARSGVDGSSRLVGKIECTVVPYGGRVPADVLKVGFGERSVGRAAFSHVSPQPDCIDALTMFFDLYISIQFVKKVWVWWVM